MANWLVTLGGWLVAATTVISMNVYGASLANGKATDESVCDMTPNTTGLIARSTLIPADSPAQIQTDVYFRLSARFVSDHCSDGQVLILGSRTGDSIDQAVLTKLANLACVVADVSRVETTARGFGTSVVHGYELRCRIARTRALRDELSQLEAAEPTSSVVARVQNPKAAAKAQPSTSPSLTRRDCDKMTLATTIMGGGPCR